MYLALFWSALVGLAMFLVTLFIYVQVLIWQKTIQVDVVNEVIRKEIIKGNSLYATRNLGALVGVEKSFRRIELKTTASEEVNVVADSFGIEFNSLWLREVRTKKLETKIYFDAGENSELARITYYIDLFDSTGYLVVFAFMAFLSTFPVVLWLSNRRHVRFLREIDSQKNAGIARMTQMMAHDVRKPFTTVQMALNLVRDARDFDEIQSFLPIVSGEITNSLMSVNGLIEDVLEIGRDSDVVLKEDSPIAIVRRSLNEVSTSFSRKEIEIVCSWHHMNKVLVDQKKIGRVLINILSNACEAMSSRGSIFISTTQKAKNFVEFSVLNSGSFIEKSELSKLFENFYSKGKAGGTGLGLAIAKKIVEGHGGKIWALSSEEDLTVEFVFTLKIADSMDVFKEVTESQPLKDFSAIESARSLNSADRSSKVVEDLKIKLKDISGSAPVTVGIVEDEEVYRNGFCRLAANLDMIKVVEFSSPIACISAFKKETRPDFLIVDVDLNHKMDGFELIAALRDRFGYENPICINSNRSSSEDIQKSIDAGATTFCPKPLTEEHLLRFLIDGWTLASRKS